MATHLEDVPNVPRRELRHNVHHRAARSCCSERSKMQQCGSNCLPFPGLSGIRALTEQGL